MNTPMAVLAGAAAALLASAPSVFLYERALKAGTRNSNVGIGEGLAAILVSFVVLTAFLLVVYLLAREAFFTFGCSLVVAFLALWGTESIRGWRAAQAAGKAKRKDE